MDWKIFCLALSLTWIAIYVLDHLLRRGRSRAILPISFPRGHRAVAATATWHASSTKVSLRKLHLRIETTRWNYQQDTLANWLARNRPWARGLTIFYNVGAVLGVLGLIGSLVLLFWAFIRTAAPLLSSLFSDMGLRDTVQGSRIPMRRSLPGPVPRNSQGDAAYTDARSLKPIIPGINVPLYHLPVILVTVFIGQVVHEAGHAISAALDSVPLLSIGASVLIFLPSGFVSLSSFAVDALEPFNRLRIVAAGPYHNLVFWCVLVTATQVGIGSVIWSVPYIDISSRGRVAVTVDQDSSLQDHIPPGSLITTLDDTKLDGSSDIWTSYLTQPQLHPSNNAGWCVPRPWYLGMPTHCCPAEEHIHNDTSSGLSCFTSADPIAEERCLHLAQFPMVSHSQAVRCVSARDCIHGFSCVQPHSSEKLVRLTVVSDPWSSPEWREEVILWKGPREQIWKQVTVGTLIPRVQFLPLWLPLISHIAFEYLKMATLSLCFFNLLPLPLLDGAQILDIILESASCCRSPDAVDLEAAANSQRPLPRQRYLQAVWIVTVILLGCTAVPTVLQLQ